MTDDEAAILEPKLRLPRREAPAKQALVAIAFVFFQGFALAKAV